MSFGKETVCVGAGFAICLLLGGCIGLNRTPLSAPRDAQAFTPRPRQAPNIPDLRIASDTRSSSAEIPLVPLPLPPGERPASVPAAPDDKPKPPAAQAMPPATEAPPLLRVSDTTPAPAVGIENARRLHRLATERYDSIDSYIARLTRREQVRGENKPEEVLLFKFRKEPWSVYLKWLGPQGRGREVVYVKGQYENKIHTLLAAGDMPLAPAGKRMALAPDNVFVRSASRHPIDEAGFGACLDRIGRALTALERGDQRLGLVADLGAINRPEFTRPVPSLELVLPPGLDPSLPRGGRRMYCFDPDTSLPVLIVTRDHLGQEVEYYFYDRLPFPVRLDDNDFNPDKLWNRSVARP